MPDASQQKSSTVNTIRDQLLLVVQYADRLEDLVKSSAGLSPAQSVSAIIRKLATATGVEYATLRQLFNALDNLRMLSSESGDGTKAIDKIKPFVGPDPLPGLDEKISQIVAAVEAYSDDNPIAISIKAQRLLFMHSNMFVDAEVITDARPVFDSKGDRVFEYLVGNSLVVTYHVDEGDDQTGRHNHARIHIQMDMDDILKLRAACDRALLKIKTLKSDLGDRVRVLGDNA